MPMLAPIVTVVSPALPRRNGCLSASSRRSATRLGLASAARSPASTTNSSPPRRPERVDLADDALQSRGDGLQQFVADGVAERVVDRLEVVEVDEQRRDGGLLARGPGEHLLDAVDDQRAVRQVGERIVRRHERELLFARGELLVGPLALALERLAHPQQAELQRQLEHLLRLCEQPGGRPQALGLLAHHLEEDVAPPEHAPRHLLQRGRAVRSELAEDERSLTRGVVGHLERVARDPAGDGDRGVDADALEALLHGGVDRFARLSRALGRLRPDVLDAGEHRLAEAPQLLRATRLGLLGGRARRRLGAAARARGPARACPRLWGVGRHRPNHRHAGAASEAAGERLAGSLLA